MAQTASLRALAEPLLGEVGLELWDLEVSRTAVRFLVDRAEGVDLDALSDASRVISDLLDAHEELAPPAGYSLEVSSPGLERTLRSVEHYRRFLGSEVAVKTSRPIAGGRRHRGSLVAVDESGIVLAVEEPPSDPLPIRFEEIERARTVFVWESGAPRPGARRTAPPAARSSRPAASSLDNSWPSPSRGVADRPSALGPDADLARGLPASENIPAAHPQPAAHRQPAANRQKDSSR